MLEFDEMTTKTRNGLTFGWRFLATIFFFIISLMLNQYNKNEEKHNQLLAQLIKDVSDIKQNQAVAQENKIEIFDRIGKVEKSSKENGEDIAELFGFTGLKYKRFDQ